MREEAAAVADGTGGGGRGRLTGTKETQEQIKWKQATYSN